MDKELLESVDRYIDSLFVPVDPVLDVTLKSAEDAGMPAIQVSAGQGKLLYLLARLIGAKRILELGTLAGYSTIWLGRALPPGGRLLSLEYSPKHATVARANIGLAGLSDCVEVRVGSALDSLADLLTDDVEPFDMVFIDADKGNYPAYLEEAIKLTRPGGLIVGDNVVRGGRVLDEKSDDGDVRAIRRFNAALANHPRLEALILQQVTVKSHDGLSLARVRE